MFKNILITLNFLNQREKIIFLLIFALILAGIVFDIITTALIYPLVNTILNDNYTFNFLPDFFKKYNFFDLSSSEYRIPLIIIVLIAFFYLLKAIILTIKIFYLEKSIANLQKRLAHDLYQKYLDESLNFMKLNNSSKLIRNIQGEVTNFCTKNIPTILNLISDIILFFSISFVLIYLQPLLSLLIITFFILIGSFFAAITKKSNYQFGELRTKFSKYLIKHLMESFNGFRVIKIFHKEKFFLSIFKHFSKNEIEARKNQLIFQNLPLVWLEFFGILTILLILIFTTYYKYNFDQIFSFLALFMVAMYRILPSINRILKSIQALRFGNVSLRILQENLEENSGNDKEKKSFNEQIPNIEFQNNIKISNLYFKYKDNENYIIKNLNAEIKKNNITGIFGKSGSGKSTLIDLICGLIEPSRGEITINDYKINNNYFWQSKIGIVPQEVYLLDDTIKKNIAFGVNEKNIDNVSLLKSLENSDLNHFVKEMKNDLETVIGEQGSLISGGQRQRIGIARALYLNPKVLIFDEATTALDKDTEKNILETIIKIKKDTTIIIVSHNLEVMKICDEIINLDENKTS